VRRTVRRTVRRRRRVARWLHMGEKYLRSEAKMDRRVGAA
jgi:hypothetical protein